MLTKYTNLDEDGRICVTTDREEWAGPGSFTFEFPDDFDFSKQNEYAIKDGELLYSPKPPSSEEIEAQKQALRQSQMSAAVGLFVRSASITDEQALTVSAFYDDWVETDHHYKVGDRCNYQDRLYRCKTEHDSQLSWNPADSPSLWVKILKPGEIPEWEPVVPGVFDGYELGQKVTHNGKTWISTYEQGLNIWEPGVVGTEAMWKEVTE